MNDSRAILDTTHPSSHPSSRPLISAPRMV